MQQVQFTNAKSNKKTKCARETDAGPKVDLTEVVAYLEGEVSAKTAEIAALRTDVERISQLVEEQHQAHTVKEYLYLTEIAALAKELDAQKKEFVDLRAVVENFSQMSERISALESASHKPERARKSSSSTEDAAPKAPRKASKGKKVRPPPSYQYHGWSKEHLLTLLQCVLTGAPPASVVSFVDATGAKDLTALSDLATGPDAMAPGSVIKPKLSKLMEAVSEYYDDTSAGQKSFSNSVMRKLTDLRKAVAHSEEYAALEIRIRKICEARKDVLRNGLPTEIPSGPVTNSNSLSLLRPVEVAQVPGKPIRYVPPRQSTDMEEITFGMHSLALDLPNASAIGTSSPRGSLGHTPKGSQATESTHELFPDDENDDDDEEEELEEEEEEEEEKEEENDGEDDIDMDLSFEQVVSTKWNHDWTKIRDHPSLFGEETTASKVIKIYARVSNDNSDKKRVLAKVACGVVRYEHLAKTVLNDLS